MKESDYESIISELTIIAGLRSVVSTVIKTEKTKYGYSFRYEKKSLNDDIFYNIVRKSELAKKYGLKTIHPIMCKYASVLKKNISITNSEKFRESKINSELKYWLNLSGV